VDRTAEHRCRGHTSTPFRPTHGVRRKWRQQERTSACIPRSGTFAAVARYVLARIPSMSGNSRSGGNAEKHRLGRWVTAGCLHTWCISAGGPESGRSKDWMPRRARHATVVVFLSSTPPPTNSVLTPPSGAHETGAGLAHAAFVPAGSTPRPACAAGQAALASLARTHTLQPFKAAGNEITRRRATCMHTYVCPACEFFFFQEHWVHGLSQDAESQTGGRLSHPTGWMS